MQVHFHREVEVRMYTDHTDVYARRSLRRSLLPLATIVATFFLPFVRGCEGKAEVPVKLFEWHPFTLFIWAPFLAAALLLLGIGVALHRRAGAGWPAWIAGAGTATAISGSLVYLREALSGELRLDAWHDVAMLGILVAALVLTAICIHRAVRHTGPRRLQVLLLIYTLQALQLAVWVLCWGNLMYGAYLYLAAVAALLLTSVRWRSRSPALGLGS
jgi:hypothetical protein